MIDFMIEDPEWDKRFDAAIDLLVQRYAISCGAFVLSVFERAAPNELIQAAGATTASTAVVLSLVSVGDAWDKLRKD